MNSIRNGLGMREQRSRGNQADREIRISMRLSPKFITRSSPTQHVLEALFVHMDDALCCIWRRSVRGQSTLTVVGRSYANFRELRKAEVLRTPRPGNSVNKSSRRKSRGLE
jgi:hypothetical protein